MDPVALLDVQTYRWTKLGENAFRVFEVLSLEPAISISIRIVDRSNDKLPEYHAISYAWGDGEATEPISCDGKMLLVTPHLLEGLRCVCAASAYRTLWVDAICIDQEDAHEKSMQVANMHYVFRDAKSVLVWLGPAQDDSDIAMAALEQAKDYKSNRPDDVKEVLVRLKTYSNNMFDASSFKSIAHLSRRAWFRRLWIAQEFIIGQSVSFYCGLRAIDSNSFLRILGNLSIFSFGGREPPNYLDEPNLFEGFKMLGELNRVKTDRLENKGPSFFDIVMLGRHRETKEPVDRLYAAFGLAEGPDVIYREQIPVDYSAESKVCYWRVYVQFGKIALLNEPNLRLLRFTTSYERPPRLPSWCPNLNSDTETTEMDQVFTAGCPAKGHGSSDQNPQTEVSSSSCTGHPNFRGEAENHVQISNSTDTIKIWGATLDQIETVNQTTEWHPNYDTEDLLTVQPFAKQMLEWLDNGEELCAKTVKTPEVAKYVFEDILVGANDRDNEHDRYEQAEEPISVVHALKEILHQILDLKPDIPAKDQNPELSTQFELFYAWIEVTYQLWANRRLFATKLGRLGFGSKHIEEGDSVCMLYSGKTLYVLRPQKTDLKTYSFVSDSYVLDYMDGQVFDLLDKGTVTEELFAIE